MSTSPTIFRVATGSRIAGLIEYLLVFPIVAILACALLGALGNWLIHVAHVPRGVVVPAVLLGCLLTIIGLLRFAVRDYRRRAGLTVVVDDDAVTVTQSKQTTRISFDDVVGVRLSPRRGDAQCILDLASGKAYRLPADVVPFSKIRAALETTLVTDLAIKLGEQIAAGRAVRIHENGFHARARILRGFFLMCLGPILILSVRGIAFGLAMCRGGYLAMRRGWRGRGVDFEVTRDGIRPVRSISPSDLRTWSQLRAVHSDDVGIVLRFEDGWAAAASPFAINYWPFAVWAQHTWPASTAIETDRLPPL